MANVLIINEKPSVSMEFSRVLGVKQTEKHDGYIEGYSDFFGCTIWITWCIGHLVTLSFPEKYDEKYKKWNIDDLPFLPKEYLYEVIPDVKKQFNVVKKLLNTVGTSDNDRKELSTLSDEKKFLVPVDEVVNACDAGREGELIFRFVYEVAGCKKPMRRLWISSMEDGAIKAGFASLKDGRDYGALFASALCRAKADWLIGINATRLFSCLYGKTLNVGRVQTPTLKMLTDRDAAISHFQKEKYYHVRLDLSGADAASERISDKAEADALKGACEAGKAVCVSLTREKKTAAPPKLFDLTSLQRETNRIFGYTANRFDIPVVFQFINILFSIATFIDFFC